MALHIYNTAKKSKELFIPRDEGRVSMYVCGPTVYDIPHIGHGRTALTYDIMRRYLMWLGYDVVSASNITDVDDKIIARAIEEGRSEQSVSDEFSDLYDYEMRRLGILPTSHQPRATEFIDEMVDTIRNLLDSGHAYIIPDSGIYFHVEGLPEYGKLAGRQVVQMLEDAGGRVEVDTDKKSPLDFALWKASSKSEPSWSTPWMTGRPGRHTECVAMSLSTIGEGFDIHGGGSDLIFPHHQNELAQAVALKQEFARYWTHSAMVNVGGEKMSKSAGNFSNLTEAIDEVGSRAIRMATLQTHYRQDMEMNANSLQRASSTVAKMDAFAHRMQDSEIQLNEHASVAEDLRGEGQVWEIVSNGLKTHMDDDFSTPSVIASVFDAMHKANSALDANDTGSTRIYAQAVFEMLGVLGIYAANDSMSEAGEGEMSNEDVKLLVRARMEARNEKNFDKADAIREELFDNGITLEDKPDKTIWRRR